MSEPDEEDVLAAEYVLGTLDAAERADAAERLGRDARFAGAVAAWEDRLAPLLDGVREVAPPADAYAGIAARLFGAPGAVPALRRQVRRWRGATAGLALLAASLIAWIGLRSAAAPPPGARRYTAVLRRDADAPAMLVEVDLAARSLTVRPLGAAAPAGRAYELWIIDPKLDAPRSLGLVPAGAGTRDALTRLDASVVTGATYAVTVEPAGGSPTGLPTAAPVLTGTLLPPP